METQFLILILLLLTILLISNLKYSADNKSLTSIKEYNNTIINIFNSNEQ